jgi:DNA polymerase-1
MALMLLDTYGLVYRAFFALPGLTTSKGVPINAVYGFTMMLNKLIADEKPTHVVAAFDKGMPAHRIALFAQYKAQRRVMPDELRSQFALVRRVLETYRIPIDEIEGHCDARESSRRVGRADGRRYRRPRPAADRRRSYDGAHDAPRHH